jgi:hypothetical protein
MSPALVSIACAGGLIEQDRLPTCSQNRTPKRREARPSSGAGLLTFLLTCCFFGASDGIRTHDTQDHNRGYGRSEDLIVGVSPAY